MFAATLKRRPDLGEFALKMAMLTHNESVDLYRQCRGDLLARVNRDSDGAIVGGGGGRRAAAARQRPRPHGGVLSPTSVLAGGSTTATN